MTLPAWPSLAAGDHATLLGLPVLQGTVLSSRLVTVVMVRPVISSLIFQSLHAN